jgi:hypothetical protein
VTTPAGTSGSVTFTVSPGSTTFSPIRVHAGGAAYTDPLGQVWAADNGFISWTGTANFVGTVTGASAPPLYPTARYSAPGTNLTYQTAVPNGAYTVDLKFLDAVNTGAGMRLFNIVVNGQTVASNFDITGRSGGPWQALDFPFTVNVTTGLINIQLVPVVGNAKIGAIEILAGSAPAPALTSISPATGTKGTTVPVTITGTGFTSDVVINAGRNITVSNVTVTSPTQITANLAIAAGTPPGTVSVSVTAPGGTATVPFTTQ